MPPSPETDARQLALDLVFRVTVQKRMLSDALQSDDIAKAAPADRAAAQRLASMVLRHTSRADAVLKPLTKTPPSPQVRAILRLGTVELLALDGAPHGVVHAAVQLAKTGRGTARGAGLVNAVLRRVVEEGVELWAKAPPQRLPNWLRGRLGAAYGNAGATAIEAAHERPAPIDLTAKTDAEALAEATIGTLLPTGSVRLTGHTQVSALPGFETGEFWVQDVGAALAAKALAPVPGERVLDLCAAPGGKTLQLAAAGAHVTALDVSEHRLARLNENLTRCALTAEVVTADALDWQPAQPFDAILLDAPCSATGTIRRHPDLPFVKDASDLKSLKALQSQMLDRACDMLVAGGRLVFCTCSLLPEEGEEQLSALLERRPDMALDAAALELPGVPPDWRSAEGGLRLRPDFWAEAGGIDGFFIAALRRTAP